MSIRVIMAGLRTMGTEQNRKVYARHGVGKKMYGVSYGNLNKLRKQIGTDQALAVKLWASGNHDARVLATMVADPARTKSSTLDAWARNLDSYVLADALRDLVPQTPFAFNKFKKWSQSKAEFVGQVGWGLLSYRPRNARLRGFLANQAIPKEDVRPAQQHGRHVGRQITQHGSHRPVKDLRHPWPDRPSRPAHPRES